MHGIIRPIPRSRPPSEARARIAAALGVAARWRNFLLIVALPSLMLAGYYYLVAADQYQSEAHYTVTAGGSSGATPGGFGQLLGIGIASDAQTAANSLNDYLRSHDVVAELQPRLDLLGMFHRPEADILNRLRDPAPTPELLLKYYRGKVKVHYDRETGLTTLQVRTFRPDDSWRLARALLELGERRVNALNARSYNDAVASAQRQLREAEIGAADTQRSLTAYRQDRGDINPQSSGEAQLQLVSQLKASLSAARAQLATMASAVSASSPQYVALSRQVRSLEREVSAQSGTIAGSGATIARDLGGYEALQVRQAFSQKRYDAAASAMEKAREDARRQQLYLVRVVDVNRPVKSLFPQRGRIVLTVFVALLLTYAIGWLILAGVREHAA